jgi:hypothetical protein
MIRTDGKRQVWLTDPAWETIAAVLRRAVAEEPAHPAFRDGNGANSPAKRLSVRKALTTIDEALKGR